MGLLDDAIREHLDLKRRRGADPAEVERAEREALGPVRRNREPAVAESGDEPATAAAYDQAADGPDDIGPAPAGAYDQGEEGDWSFDAGATQADLPSIDHDEHVPGRSTDADRAAGADPTDDLFDGDAFDAAAFEASEPAAPAGEVTPAPPPRFVHDSPGHETAEYDVEGALGEDDDAAGEPGDDMLEETPEFLQDTPDHDRLWFEQRPPRDFDFDS